MIEGMARVLTPYGFESFNSIKTLAKSQKVTFLSKKNGFKCFFLANCWRNVSHITSNPCSVEKNIYYTFSFHFFIAKLFTLDGMRHF